MVDVVVAHYHRSVFGVMSVIRMLLESKYGCGYLWNRRGKTEAVTALSISHCAATRECTVMLQKLFRVDEKRKRLSLHKLDYRRYQANPKNLYMPPFFIHTGGGSSAHTALNLSVTITETHLKNLF